ncbi:MAG TPA: UvrD-helicase domain-containing protein [Candidatus Dormibacteraeota bacterium]|nr:UvrD-helicase domain-containing protein [Candidatus Dormibacteraeota bacterium]
MNFLDDLNPQQREAVETAEGPLLILAGAGTGKTRAITYRVANFVARGVPGEAILAVTFTNKAAEQMKQRITSLLVRAGLPAADPWVSTFHSLCARLLRREAPRLGLRRDFAIFDDDDQIATIKLALKRLDLEERVWPPRVILSRISHAKNHGQTPEDLLSDAQNEEQRTIAKVFHSYQEMLKQNSALDFDDLLLRAVEVLKHSAEVRESWQRRFRYIHVDEYQDTNRVQYDLLRELTGPTRNLCVVGDEDQSIYRWRGADVGILLRFAEDFVGAKIVRLEQNYRSTQPILDAAAALVGNNSKRLGKTLVAVEGHGPKLKYFEARGAQEEAEYVGAMIQSLSREDSAVHYAVAYRTNFQSRAFEEVFRRLGIRYRLLGGFSFYQRAEVKDALSYARLAFYPDDDIALRRVINTPPRGIGKSTIEALDEAARARQFSLWAAIAHMLASESSGRAVAPLKGFRELILELQQDLAHSTPSEFLRHVLEKTGYLDMLGQRNNAEDAARAENLKELVNAMAEGAEAGESLTDFLDRAALVSDADMYDDRAAVTLLTLHNAKGLEFDHVFLTGMEDGLFPHSRSNDSTEGLEEERRLCYVGMTRARKTLTLTRAVYRRVFGDEQRLKASKPSRFLNEIPGDLIETSSGSLADAGETRRYEPDPEYSYSPEEFVRRVRHTTSRDSLAPKPSRAPSSPRVRPRSGQSDPLIGQRVRHPNYGVGTVIAVEGDEEDRKLTVRFAGHGAKKFVEKYAQLVPA